MVVVGVMVRIREALSNSLSIRDNEAGALVLNSFLMKNRLNRVKANRRYLYSVTAKLLIHHLIKEVKDVRPKRRKIAIRVVEAVQ
jgi:hypothetical protein